MKKLTITFSLVIVLLAVPDARAATTEVQLTDSPSFSPSSVNVVVGGSVHWSRAPGSTFPHSVRQDNLIFWNGGITTGAINLTVKFSAGLFHYYCEQHGGPNFGMQGMVRVPVSIGPGPAGPNFNVVWAMPGVQTGTRFDVQFKIWSSGAWQTWKSNTSSFASVFGSGGSPVVARSAVNYYLRARSRKTVNGVVQATGYSQPKFFRP